MIRRNTAARARYEVMDHPFLCDENFVVFAKMLDRLNYQGPVCLSTDCSKVKDSMSCPIADITVQLSPRLEYVSTYAPLETNEAGVTSRVGAHLLGAHSLSWDDQYVVTQQQYEAIYERVEAENLLAESVRLILLSVSQES